MIQTVVLRSLLQASYSPNTKLGHFGLALKDYASEGYGRGDQMLLARIYLNDFARWNGTSWMEEQTIAVGSWLAIAMMDDVLFVV